MGRKDVLNGREPVGVEDHHGVRGESVEAFLAQARQARTKAEVLAVVEFATDLLGHHNGWYVGNDRGTHNLTHRLALRSSRRSSPVGTLCGTRHHT